MTPWLRRGAGLAATVGLALCAACGGTGSSGGLPAAGHGSPAAAVSGFLQGLARGDLAATCSYAAPNEVGTCRAGFSGVSAAGAGLGIGLGNEFTDGDQALVVLVASNFCLGAGSAPTTTVCFSNTDPSKGLPTSDAGFPAALDTALNGAVNPLAAAVKVNGSWYTELAAGGGAAGSTGATGSTGSTGATGTT